MTPLSPTSTILLFGRTALRRLLNRCTHWTHAIGKTPNSDTAIPTTPVRTATVHRAQASLLRRMLGLWLPLLMLAGLAIMSLGTLFALIEAVHLREARHQPVLTVPAEHYAMLAEAAAAPEGDVRQALVEQAVSSMYNGAVGWMVFEGRTLATRRLAERGLAGFQAAPEDSDWGGTLAYLSDEGRRDALRAVGLYLAIFHLAAIGLVFGVMGTNLTGSDPAMVWLWQFPISRRILFLCKMSEYLLDTPASFMAALFYSTTAWLCGASLLGGLGIGALLGLSTVIIVAAVRLTAETYLMQRVGRRMRGWIVAAAATSGSTGLLVCMLCRGSQTVIDGILSVADALPNWFFWNPLSAGVGAEAMIASAAGGLWLLAGPTMAAIAGVGAVSLASRLTADGLASGHDAAAPRRAQVGRSIQPTWFKGAAWKDLLQLYRQPEHLANIITAPLTTFVLLYLGGYRSVMDYATQNGAAMSATIFGGAVYLLLVSASRMLMSEFRTLWMLQCQPRPLADAVRSKARVWAVIVLAMTLGFVVWASLRMPDDALAIFARTPMLMVSLWWLSEVSFGLTALNVTVTGDNKVQLKANAILLPALVSSVIGMAVFSGSLWQQAGTLALLYVFNRSVRERQLLELEWLTEPVETPPKRLYAMHGLMALMCAYALRAMVASVLSLDAELSPMFVHGASTAFSVAAIGGLFWLWLRRNGLRLFPRTTTQSVPIRWQTAL